MELFGKQKNKIKDYWENLLDFVFPKECFRCKKEGEYLCSACFDKIEYIEEFPCFICHAENNEKGICAQCAGKTGIDQIIIAAKYNDYFVGQLVEEFKYNFLEEISGLLSQIMVEQIRRKNLIQFVKNHQFVPIPLHRKRLMERGFNQSFALANLLGFQYNCVVRDDLLRRRINTIQQAKLSRSERQENVKNAFVVNSANALSGNFILIDDVLTTGSTFISSAKVLKSAGANSIVCLAVCHG
ncbi:ComF family protein [Patescibacteria group bacterium]|nr:ComF family protein [Patescibacteria group bacterium]